MGRQELEPEKWQVISAVSDAASNLGYADMFLFKGTQILVTGGFHLKI